MHPWKIDVPVLMIFFNRPEQFKKVFEQVKLARPSKLFLYQDGERIDRKTDKLGIEACRVIAQDIDWDCEVYKFYQESNVGCDPSEYIAQKWAFSIVDKCIVLEDDDVPSQSFFYFCKELLDKYEFDERVNIISGMNTLGKFNENQGDYFFTTVCSIWGWASWKRVVDSWDETYSFLNDKSTLEKLKLLQSGHNNIDAVVRACENHKKSGKAHYETILAASMFLNHRVNIVPSVNLISNIGIASESTHSVDSLDKLPRGIRRVFNMDTYEMKFPLKHPKNMVEDVEYQMKVFRILGWGHPMICFYRRVESLLIKMRNREFKKIIKKLRRK